MGQQLQPLRSGTWRSGHGEKLWLSMLIDAMEEVSRPEFRAVSCDQSVLAGLRAQLARPASPYPYGASHFSLRN
jgi:hypothetical protein